jgi:5'-deoxynucleotidase YfbR-like HD superfamily hydrolase
VEDVGNHDVESEKQIVKKMVSGFSNKNELCEFWEAHLPEEGPEASREASLLYQIGKIATAWQALEYELVEQDSGKLSEFWVNARTHVKEPVLLKLLNMLEKRSKK